MNWKGDKVGYFGLHDWIRKRFGSPSMCECCGTTTAIKYEWANKTGKYLRDRNNWLRLCKPCHYAFDKISCKRWKNHEKLYKKCLNCGKEVRIFPYEIARMKYCSFSCRAKHNNPVKYRWNKVNARVQAL